MVVHDRVQTLNCFKSWAVWAERLSCVQHVTNLNSLFWIFTVPVAASSAHVNLVDACCVYNLHVEHERSRDLKMSCAVCSFVFVGCVASMTCIIREVQFYYRIP